MSSWIVPAVSTIICSTVILIITYLYLYASDKKPYLGFWAASWIVYLFAQSITLVLVSGFQSGFLTGASFILFSISMLLLIKGSYSFLNRVMPFYIRFIFYISIVWIIFSEIMNFPLIIANTPSAITLGIGTIWIGIIFLYFKEGQENLRRILGICFVLWGIHKLDYPILRNIVWLAPWGYIVSAVLSLAIAIVSIFIYYEKVRVELVEAQKILISKERRLVNIIENQRDVIFELDEHGILTFVSPACTRMFGCNDEELIGRCFIEFFQNGIWEKVKNNDVNGFNFEKQWSFKDASIKYLNIYCKPRQNSNNEFVGIFGSVQDITENKLLIEAREYDRVKTEFFANMSHELKTPLNVVLASTQLLELYNKKDITSINEKVEKTAATIKQNVFRLSRLINNIIDVTRVDTGFLELQLSNQNIVSVVEEITMSVVDYIENKGISIEFDTDVEEKVIAFDQDKIERIMLNLLSNSVKFTNKGGNIKVNINDQGSNVIISVKDTGIGIPKEKQEIIFERFRQVDKSLSRNQEGSGIGLSLVKSLIELHGGTINVNSVYGEGSEFVVTLPAVLVNDETEDNRIESFNEKKKDIEFSDIYL